MSASSEYLDALVALSGQKAQAQAQATRQRGQIIGNTLQSLGQIVPQIQQARQQQQDRAALDQDRVAQAKLRGLQTDEAQASLDAVRAGQQDEQSATNATADLFSPQPDGSIFIDPSVAAARMSAAKVHGPTMQKHLAAINDINAGITKFKQDQNDATATLANSFLQTHADKAPVDPETLNLFVDTALQNGMTDAHSAAAVKASAASGGDPRKMLEGIRNLSDKFKPKYVNAPEGSGVMDTTTGTITPGGPKAPKTETDLRMDAATVGTPQETPTAKQSAAALNIRPTPEATPSLQSENVIYKGKPTQVTFDPKSGRRKLSTGEDVTGQTTPIPPANTVINTLSDPAMDQAAQKYLDTGQLPPGMGGPAVARNNEIMNRAARIDPSAALARNAAVYKSDAASLTNITKTLDTLSSFENTAGKNLDQFLSLASKVPDTGVPWLNIPVRAVSKGMVGSTNQAAFEAARDVALREIARVTNDPKLSGALTDSARAEVSGLSPKEATFAQIKAVAKVLKQDMANVHSSLAQQKEDIAGRIGSNPSKPAEAVAPPTGRYNPATGKVE